MKIHVFDVDKLPGCVLHATWPNLGAKSAENDPNLAPQDKPKSPKIRVQKLIKVLTDFKTEGVALLGSDRRNAQASWGDYRGVENTAEEDMQQDAGHFC